MHLTPFNLLAHCREDQRRREAGGEGGVIVDRGDVVSVNIVTIR